MCLDSIVGIGPKTVEMLNKVNIYSINDLITYYPKRYNVIKRSDMSVVNNGDKVVVDGVVEGQPTIVHLSSKLKKVIFRISNKNGVYNVNVFNQVYLCHELKYGMNVIIIGKYDKYKNAIIASEVRIGELPSNVQIEPIYYTRSGVNRKVIAKSIEYLLNSNIDIKDYIPDYLVDKYHFPDKLWSVSNIHHPSSVINYKKSLQRLKYEELFLYLLKVNYLKLCNSKDNFIDRKFNMDDIYKFISKLPFKLTSDQVTTIEDISLDMKSKKRMNRLVQGDVGSGKTIVAMIASYINFLSGYQTALMVPTEILANQHYNDALSLFSDVGMKVCLLTSNVKKRDKNKLIKEIANGDVDFIIGTQSLIQNDVDYYNLGLIITDEQHRFGVNQRTKLQNKGKVPDVLSMSATPIPRTYALTIYGDMDVSNIRTKPIGRKDVITYFKREKDILDLMKREIDDGHQVYVIAPSIEDDSDELDSVDKLREKMDLAFSKIAKVDYVHGKMDNDAKSKVMNNFLNGKVDILVSTTVIEVGVNVPNASMIVIFNANLFGLSTLHQLRGRVGRGSIQSYCILIAKESSDRLKMLENTNDGFMVSEYDFKVRGEGDLFGIRQSGDIELKLANIKRDFDLMLRVKDDVVEFLDIYYDSDKYRELFNYLDNFVGMN